MLALHTRKSTQKCLRWSTLSSHQSSHIDLSPTVRTLAAQTVITTANPKCPERLIYYGAQLLNQNEIELVTKFNAFISTQTDDAKQIATHFNDKEKIRFLVAAKNKQQQCIEDMKGYLKWKTQYLPISLTDPLVAILVL